MGSLPRLALAQVDYLLEKHADDRLLMVPTPIAPAEEIPFERAMIIIGFPPHYTMTEVLRLARLGAAVEAVEPVEPRTPLSYLRHALSEDWSRRARRLRLEQ